jgi:hypothetical protein
MLVHTTYATGVNASGRGRGSRVNAPEWIGVNPNNRSALLQIPGKTLRNCHVRYPNNSACLNLSSLAALPVPGALSADIYSVAPISASASTPRSAVDGAPYSASTRKAKEGAGSYRSIMYVELSSSWYSGGGMSIQTSQRRTMWMTGELTVRAFA